MSPCILHDFLHLQCTIIGVWIVIFVSPCFFSTLISEEKKARNDQQILVLPLFSFCVMKKQLMIQTFIASPKPGRNFLLANIMPAFFLCFFRSCFCLLLLYSILLHTWYVALIFRLMHCTLNWSIYCTKSKNVIMPVWKQKTQCRRSVKFQMTGFFLSVETK